MRAAHHPAPPVVAIIMITLLLACLSPAAGQDISEYTLNALPIDFRFHAAGARGIDEVGFEPLTAVGTMENSPCKASCWIRTSQVWAAHVLPDIDPDGASWANAVRHLPLSDGEWTLVVGGAEDSTDTVLPMKWVLEGNSPWTGEALPTLSAGDGEARGLFLPDGTPVRALACGWSGELPPMTSAGAAAASSMELTIPVIWETTTTGERILRPEFGAGLEGQVNNIGSSGYDGYVAVGGGQNGTAWVPQLWLSTDDGETWQNTELPLPVGADTGEAVDHTYDAQGRLVVAGWDQAAGGPVLPILWELDQADPQAQWIIHEPPVPAGQEGGQNNHIHKRPGRTTYAGILSQSGVAQLTLWVDDGLGGGWTAYGPADYLTNPQAGTPIAPAGIDAFGRIAATVVSASPPTGAASAAATQPDTMAAVLVPTTLTGIGDPLPQREWISLAASPNPFNPTVRITYVLPREGRVTVTIQDAAGRTMTRVDQGLVPADEERTLIWNGATDDGGHAASGVYFVRVVTAYDAATLKIVMVR